MTFIALTSRAKQLFEPSGDLTTAEGRSRERHRRAAMSAGASALAKIVSVSTALISVPLSLHYLGPERYGMWMTMSSLVAMLSFADFGIGNGLLNIVAAAHGREDRPAMREAVSSGFVVLSLIAAVIIIGFATAYPFVPWFRIFNVKTAHAQAEAGPALAAFICCFALAIPTSIVQRVQIGLQRGFMASLWQCGSSVIALIGVLTAIALHAGLPWLVLAYTGAPLLAAMLNSATFFGIVQRDISPNFRRASRRGAARVASTGLLFFVLQIMVSISYSSDNVIIAQVFGAATVPQYAVPERMFSMITMVVTMMLGPLWPAYGEALARGDIDWARRTLVRSVTLGAGVAALASATLFMIAPTVLRFWVGPLIRPSLFLLAGFGVWKVLEVTGAAISMFLNGAHVVRAQVIIATITSFTGLTLKLFLVHRIGVAGLVWSTITVYSTLTLTSYYFILHRMFSGGKHLASRAAA
jgi:O-antigen/teichoic acid export membrane protein